MFRYCFGEFFFRSVVMDYWSGPILGDTIVLMAFLLEANEYNVVDVDTVMKRQAETGHLGEYELTDESYVVYGMEKIQRFDIRHYRLTDRGISINFLLQRWATYPPTSSSSSWQT